MKNLNLKHKISLLWQNKTNILIVTIIFVIFGILYSYKFEVAEYKSSTTLILGKTSFSVNNVENVDTIVTKEIDINEGLISTYTQLIKSNNLLNQVKNNLKLDIAVADLEENMTVKRISKTDLIKITVTHSNSTIASNIANELAKVFSKKVEEIYHVNHIYIVDSAVPSETPYNIHHLKDIIFFIIAGFIVSSVYIIAKNVFDTTIKTEIDIEKETGLKTLMCIPKEKSDKNQLVGLADQKGVAFKAFQDLKTNIQFININHKENKVILITSSFSSEGKSYVSANLAVAFAKTGKKVILIDTDMRRGKQSRIFNIPNNLGFSNYLSGLDSNGIEINERINQFINETEIKNLNVITSGTIPPNPSEILTSNKLPELIKDLGVFYDFIILDAPAVLPTTDSLILSKIADSTILVSLYNKTKKEELNKASRIIQNVGGRVIGVVLNKINKGQKNSKKEVLKETSNNCLKNKNLTKWISTIKSKINDKIQEYKNKNNQLLLEAKTEKLEILEEQNIRVEKNNEMEQQMTLENILEEKAEKNQKDNIEKENAKESDKIENNDAKTDKKENINTEISNTKNEDESQETEQVKNEKNEKLSNILKTNFKKIKNTTSQAIEKIKFHFENYKEEIKQIRKEKLEKQSIEKQKKQEEMQIKAEMKKQENEEKEKLQLEEKLKKEALKNEIKSKKIIEKEEKKKFKEQEKQKQKEEARIQEELLEDNLYPKTKHNKNL